ncbi:MAG TPA: methyltransferase domain-containing protein [Candidatus Nitrosotalea sp.]|nr:methyltransferase domain-containing protein [Candidatus Nitrosotalea sp.]
MKTTSTHSTPEMETIKARQKATWESGDFGQVAKFIMPVAEQFMARLDLRPGLKLLDAACGSGNLAVIAARRGCITSGLDIASNLIGQARERAKQESLHIEFTEGDAEAMPYPDASFDVVVSMYGVMFAPQPERIVSELRRVTKPGGVIALANWTPEGFVGKMFAVFGRHLPPPAGLPSPLLWGDEAVVRARFNGDGDRLRLTRYIARMICPFDPASTVDFFRRYYGPTHRAFESLKADGQAALLRDLVDLQTRHNVSPRPDETDTPAEYLEVHAHRALSNSH